MELALVLVQAIETRIPVTVGHSWEVSNLAAEVFSALRKSKKEIELIKFAGL